jgi:glycosyltransferase involved in cell wall biosynthesis
MIRIQHIISSLQVGGAESMLVRLATRLDRTQLESRVLSLKSDVTVGRQLTGAGITLDVLDLPHSMAGLGGALRRMRRFRPHIIHTWLYHADLFGVLAKAAIPSAQLVWSLRATNLDQARYGRLTRVLAAFSRLPKVILVNARTGQAAHAARGYHPRQWLFIPNGFDLDEFRPDAEQRAAVRKELGAGPDELLIGMVARVDPMKDHATFLAAAQRMPQARFVLIGRGTERLPHGLGERSDVPRLLCGLDILTLSSAFGEGFPNVLGEGMATEVPCVATDVGEARTIVGDTGHIVAPRDPDALCRAWRELDALGPQGRAELGRRARRCIEERYSIGSVVRQHEALYRDLVRDRT